MFLDCERLVEVAEESSARSRRSTFLFTKSATSTAVKPNHCDQRGRKVPRSGSSLAARPRPPRPALIMSVASVSRPESWIPPPEDQYRPARAPRPSTSQPALGDYTPPPPTRPRTLAIAGCGRHSVRRRVSRDVRRLGARVAVASRLVVRLELRVGAVAVVAGEVAHKLASAEERRTLATSRHRRRRERLDVHVR